MIKYEQRPFWILLVGVLSLGLLIGIGTIPGFTSTTLGGFLFGVLALTTFVAIGYLVVLRMVGGAKDLARDVQNPTSHIRRHWKLYVIGFIALLVFCEVLSRYYIPRNGAVATASQAALHSPAVRDLLGAPVALGSPGGFTMQGFGEGAVIVTSVELRGSERTGDLEICGVKADGDWRVRHAVVSTSQGASVVVTDERRGTECNLKSD